MPNNALRFTEQQLAAFGKHYTLVDNGSVKLTPKAKPQPVDVLAPQWQFWQLVKGTYPDAEYEVDGLIPNRKYRADVLLRAHRLVLEHDGWQSHGKTLKGWLSGYERDHVFRSQGWDVLRFAASQVSKSPRKVMETINAVVRMSR